MSTDASNVPTVRSGSAALTIMAIVSDPTARALFPKVIQRDRLIVTDDMAEVLALAEGNPPDIAFVEIGTADPSGLALVHHLKAVVPSVTVYALAARTALEAAANAVALGGAGLIMMPIAGDDVASAVDTVRMRLADRSMRADLERAALAYARATGWMARVAELAEGDSRYTAAERFLELIVEATGTPGAAVYLSAGDRPTELTRAAASPALDKAPQHGMEPDVIDFARREHLMVVPLAIRSLKAGHLLITPPPPEAAAGPRVDGMLKLLATQAATAFALLGERERAGAAVIKDPASSAYSFAYYVDVAGREIDKARRYNRRFSIATIAFEPPPGEPNPPLLSRAEMADQLLKAARDTDVLAHVDEHEFHLLMPESDGLTAHAARRRVLARMAERGSLPKGLLVGVSTFPHDGQNLSQLLRVARRRAEATRYSLVRRLTPDQSGLLDMLDALGWELETPPVSAVTAARAVELPIADAVALATSVVSDSVRGGATLIAVAHHAELSLGAAIRASLGSPRENVTIHAVDVRSASPGETVEALAVIAEHGSYAFIGRSDGGVVRGLHAADPLLADLLAERLGRAAGLRLFS